MKENARTIIRLIPFFDAFLKISPLDIGPRVVYANGNLLICVPGGFRRGSQITYDAGTALAIDRYFSPRNSDEQATENDKAELNSALLVLVRHFDSY
jgi:hypothetical protein